MGSGFLFFVSLHSVKPGCLGREYELPPPLPAFFFIEWYLSSRTLLLVFTS